MAQVSETNVATETATKGAVDSSKLQNHMIGRLNHFW